jgi:hypothetical protein
MKGPPQLRHTEQLSKMRIGFRAINGQYGLHGLGPESPLSLRPGSCLPLVHGMTEPTNDEIRIRAHQLWEEAGKPEGREEEFWHLAEQELRNADKSSPVRTPDNL